MTSCALLSGLAPLPLLADAVGATSIRGFLSVREAQVFFRPVAMRSVGELPIETSIANRTKLLNLKSGDFVVVSGALSDIDRDGTPDKVAIEAIESVGLRDILGTWRSPTWEVVRFENFSRMSLYKPPSRFTGTMTIAADRLLSAPMAQLKRLGFSKFRDMHYTLAPEQGSTYSIFLVENTNGLGRAPIFVGRLEVQKRALKLEIYDSRSGRSSEVLSLKPVRD